MSIVVSSTVRRWLVPASAALAVIGGGVAIGAITNAADPALQPRTAAELLVDLQTAKVDGMSGTVVARADLGLPALPSARAGSPDLFSLLSGTHTVRVWYASPDQARVALLDPLGETDVITNGTDVWIWSSKDNTAIHGTVPAGTTSQGGTPFPMPPVGGMPFPMPSGGGLGLTPEALAKAAVALLEPSTEITTDGSASVAGRDAYELVLAPRDPASLIGSIHLAIDAAEHVPLRVAVLARGSDDPAIEVAFTQVSFGRPDASQFTFNPPPGATVIEEPQDTEGHDPGKPDVTEPDQAKPGQAKPGEAAPGADRPNVAVIGTGWTSVFVARLPAEANEGAEQGAPGGLAGMLAALPKVSGAWGSGSLLASRLFTVLVTDDGRILAGAVSPDRLYQAAADPAAKLGP
jgi:outer membrane lipoprotein-sorting protein